MQTFSPRSARLIFCLRWLWFSCLTSFLLSGLTMRVSRAQEAQQSREGGPPLRIPRQQAQATAALDGAVRFKTISAPQSPVVGAVLTLLNTGSKAATEVTTGGEGIFRAFPLAPGEYSLSIHADGFSDFTLEKVALRANEVLTLEITLVRPL